MKKSNLIYGIVYTFIGILFLFLAIFSTSKMLKLGGIFYGMAGGIGINGIFMIVRYFCLKNPQKMDIYTKRLEIENIERNDELKQKLRDKSGKYTYFFGIIVISLSAFVYSILDSLEIIEAGHFVIYLSLYLVSQYVVGIFIFNYLLKKYT